MNVTSHGVKNNTVFQKTNNLVMFFFWLRYFWPFKTTVLPLCILTSWTFRTLCVPFDLIMFSIIKKKTCLRNFVNVRGGRLVEMLGPRGMSFVAHRSRVCVGFRHQGSPPSPAGSNGGCCGSLSPGPASIQVEHVFPQAHKRTSKAGHTHTQSTESSVYLGTHENMNNAAQFFPPSLPDQDGSPAVEYIHLPGRKVCSLQ